MDRPISIQRTNRELMPRTGCDPDRTIDDDWIVEHYPRIHRAAWLMTGDAWEAEDLAQETFIVALRRWQSFQGRSSRETWLYGILIRLSKRRNRAIGRMKRRLQNYVEQLVPTMTNKIVTEDPQKIVADRQWQESVWADVSRLPEPQRIAVTLRFAEGMSYQQIAHSVGCATGTAKTRVHHGIKRLRQTTKFQSVNSQSSTAVVKSKQPKHVHYPARCNE